jgi:gas vesicle protein
MEDLTMNENQQVNGTSRSAGSSVATGFVLGALVGAGIALLLAPAPGKETRRRLADAGARWGNAARTKFDEVRDKSREPRQAPRTELKA